METKLTPVSEPQRIVSLDVLRGFALLGILVINIQSFSMIFSAYMNPTAYGDLTGANYWVWLLSHVLTDQKFMTIFSMLFGAGIVLLSSRVEARGQSATGVHYQRMFWLIVFGLLHAYLLWYGDILFLYGICGLVVYLFRKLSPRKLLVLGLLTIAVSSALFLFFGWSMQFWPPEALEELTQDWQPTLERTAEEVAIYQGGWLEQMNHRVPKSFELETFGLLIWGFWRAGGLMLVGMGLYKVGVFTLKRSAGFYAALIMGALLVGIPTVSYGVHRNFTVGWDIHSSFFFGWQFNYWGSLIVSMGWIGLVMLVCQRSALTALTRPLAAVGQTAFSNYILQTVICTSIFYGHGLGVFGQVERVGQIAIVAAVWAFQLAVSPLWLRRFRFGPLEWLWRTLTYGRLQPMRVSQPAA
jgi:uncharacterized protein